MTIAAENWKPRSYDRHATAMLPTEPPFLSFYTPTFRRPHALARCMESIRTQTAVEYVEQIIVPNHAGYGVVDSLYRRIAWYAEALRGQYVHVLCDDDELAGPGVVSTVKRFAAQEGTPPVIVVRSEKGPHRFPMDPIDAPPIRKRVDMSCYILRRDIWIAHAKDYGETFSGDHDHVCALRAAGVPFAFCDLLFVRGRQSLGDVEATC